MYLLRCADGTLYCGWSTDPERRLRQHRAGTASRYTRSRLPVELAWTARFDTRSDAMREEARIKRLPAAEKRRLVGRAQRLTRLTARAFVPAATTSARRSWPS